MSNCFSYLRNYQELTPYLEAVEKIKDGEYVPNLEEIKRSCIKEYGHKIPWGSKGLEHIPDAQVLFRITSEENEYNKNNKPHSEESIQGSLSRRMTLERVFNR